MNMNQLRDLCFSKDREKIREYLNNKSNENLLKIFANIIDSNPFGYEPAIEIIVSRLYSDDDRFVKLLCKLIENTLSDLAFGKIIEPIKKIAVKQQEKTLVITKKND